MSGNHNQFQKDKSYLDQKPRMKGLRWHVKPDGDDLLVCFDYAGKPGDEYIRFVRTGQQSDFECPRCGHCCKADLARVGEVGVWGKSPEKEPLCWTVSTGWVYADDTRPQARSLTDELMDCVDRLGSEADTVDPRVWQHLLVYAPKHEQEPVAWANSFDLQTFDMKVRTGPDLHHTVPLYTAPPKKQWVEITDEEIDECEQLAAIRYQRHKYSVRGQIITPADGLEWHFAQAIEAKLKEKNT